MLIYCMKCKRNTQTLNEKIVNKSRITGICSICRTKKSQFIKHK